MEARNDPGNRSRVDSGPGDARETPRKCTKYRSSLLSAASVVGKDDGRKVFVSSETHPKPPFLLSPVSFAVRRATPPAHPPRQAASLGVI